MTTGSTASPTKGGIPLTNAGNPYAEVKLFITGDIPLKTAKMANEPPNDRIKCKITKKPSKKPDNTETEVLIVTADTTK